jgi:hypothetical protein
MNTRNMRIICLVAAGMIALNPAPLAAAQPPHWSFYSELDMYLALKAGAEYRFGQHFGVSASAGACLIGPSMISWNLFGVVHLRPFGRPFQFDLAAGVLQSVFDVIAPGDGGPYLYVNPGLALCLAYQHHDRFQIGARAGAAVAMGYDLGAWRQPAIMPNAAVEFRWFCRSRRAQGSGAAGRSKLNSTQRAGSDSTVIRPPWASTM